MVISLVASTRGVALLPASCIRRGTTMWRSKRAVFKMKDDSGPKLSSVSRKRSYRGPSRDRHWECTTLVLAQQQGRSWTGSLDRKSTLYRTAADAVTEALRAWIEL